MAWRHGSNVSLPSNSSDKSNRLAESALAQDLGVRRVDHDADCGDGPRSFPSRGGREQIASQTGLLLQAGKILRKDRTKENGEDETKFFYKNIYNHSFTLFLLLFCFKSTK